jgi:excisionase family DNA binding protein
MAVKTTEEPALLISVEEAARLLGISRGEGYLLAQRGELPTIKFGRAVRVHRGRLAAWVESRLDRSA